jgi:hypothetical protein
MEWVYTRAIKVSKHPPSKDSWVESHVWWMEIAKAYPLAHYLQITAFGNAVMEFVGRSITRRYVVQSPLPNVVRLVYSSTLGECVLRKLFVALNVWRTNPALWEESQKKRSLKGLPAECSHDLVIKLQRRHHQLDKDPFVNEKTCQTFRDPETGCYYVILAGNGETQALPSIQK